MKYFCILLAFIIFCMLLTACFKMNKNIDEPMVDLTDFSENFRKHISIHIDENSIKNNIATISVSQPDLIKIFNEVLSQRTDDEQQLFIEMNMNLNKYSVTNKIEAEVINSKEKWDLKTHEDIEYLIEESINEFLVHILLQSELTVINWEDMS